MSRLNSNNSWRQICFYYSIVFTITYFLVSADDTVTRTEHLALCGHQSDNPRSFIYISTLDGKISALDANHGHKQWTLDFRDGPMLSSSIHRRELNNNGQWVRLIPSLSGSLYKFDGETLETVPISTDQLLHSSFRYSDDLVFSGGKELHSYGVSADTGTILYECGINGCKNDTSHKEYLEQDVLIVQRFQQTVRAVEACTGIERWNFSVGQHDLVLKPATDIHCANKIMNLNIEIKVIIPEGLIWAVNKSNPDVKLWQYKFDSPIVTMWREDMSKVSMNQGSLEQINLFDGSQWHWGLNHPRISPNLYLGMHKRQLYVQENFNMKNLLDTLPKNTQHKKYPWHPHPAIETALIKTLSDKDNNEISIETNEVQSTTALSVLYNSEYINGNGFYLYSKDQLSENTQCSNHSNSNILFITGTEKLMLTYTEEENDTPVQVIIVSLWYWWKEVLIISITTAILLNFMLSQRLLNATTTAKDAILPPLIVERHVEIKRNDSSNDDEENSNNFNSRYLTDFEPVDCLGKGGYGVVFEAKNKIDDCNYAIKRIVLPNSRDSRDRVMREVKALAKLDHQNIVRYFNAWLECPPKGWQEEHDQQWIAMLKSSSGFPSEVTHTTTQPSDSVCIDVSQTDPSSVDSACEAFELNNIKTNSDSFVIFEKSTDNQYDNDAIYINTNTDCSIDNSDVSFSSKATEKELLNVNDTNNSESIVFEKTNGDNDTNHSESIVFEETNDDNDTNHSESIVFEETNDDNDTNHSESIVFEETNDDNDTEKKRKRKRQQSLSLDLKSKLNNHKSTKIFLYIQMQLCQRLSLRKWLKQHTSARDPQWVLNIFHQIVDAVEYVHLQGLIHRDLKPSNIFFAYDDKIKIGDFGLVTAMTENYDGTHTPGIEDENAILKNRVHTAHVGTHLYMSPEQMNGQIYNYKVDIYSLGIIFFELLTPFFTDMERIMELSNLKKSIFPKDFATDYPAEYNLLKMMLDQDPAKRPTTLGIKARPPLRNYEIANGCNIDKDFK